MSFDEHDQHLELVDPTDPDGLIIGGFAIRSADLASFLFDLRQLVARYGVEYEKLLELDLEDASVDSSVRRVIEAADR